MQVLQEFVTDPHVCHYLPHETAKTQYYFAMQMTGEEYEDLMNNGHRKFGPIFFRPVCASCVQCRPILRDRRCVPAHPQSAPRHETQ